MNNFFLLLLLLVAPFRGSPQRITCLCRTISLAFSILNHTMTWQVLNRKGASWSTKHQEHCILERWWDINNAARRNLKPGLTHYHQWHLVHVHSRCFLHFTLVGSGVSRWQQSNRQWSVTHRGITSSKAELFFKCMVTKEVLRATGIGYKLMEKVKTNISVIQQLTEMVLMLHAVFLN